MVALQRSSIGLDSYSGKKGENGGVLEVSAIQKIWGLWASCPHVVDPLWVSLIPIICKLTPKLWKIPIWTLNFKFSYILVFNFSLFDPKLKILYMQLQLKICIIPIKTWVLYCVCPLINPKLLFIFIFFLTKGTWGDQMFLGLIFLYKFIVSSLIYIQITKIKQ